MGTSIREGQSFSVVGMRREAFSMEEWRILNVSRGRRRWRVRDGMYGKAFGIGSVCFVQGRESLKFSSSSGLLPPIAVSVFRKLYLYGHGAWGMGTRHGNRGGGMWKYRSPTGADIGSMSDVRGQSCRGPSRLYRRSPSPASGPNSILPTP